MSRYLVFFCCLALLLLPQLDPYACEAQEFSRVSKSYQFSFPRSHGSHPAYATEWWYFTGHAKTAAERTFGFELTFFRVGVNPKQKSESAWAVQSIFLAHFAVTDDQGKRFYQAERITRDNFSQASAARDTLDVTLKDWSARLDADKTLRIAAEDKDIAISFEMTSQKPPALHGEAGISRKASGKYDAPYYSSFTRLRGNGQLRVGDSTHHIDLVEAWMDHEVTSSQLARGVDGWDWFAVQLESGEEIMLYQLRLPKGGVSPYSSGSIIDVEGGVENLGSDDFSIEVLEHWTSAKSGIRYPSRWVLTIPAKNIRMTVTPTLPEQEMRTKETTGVTYWEGRCRVEGSEGDTKLSGNAYVELVGYAAE